ncbi:MAG: hypothetical protein M3M89_00165 [Thermoproteota archaeon]|nr:hypothetical protein [Thermoproteota archaeon]
MIRPQRKLKAGMKDIAVHKKFPFQRKKPLLLYMLGVDDINNTKVLFLKPNKSGVSIIHNKQLFKIGTHLMRQRNAGAAVELYVCPVCKSEFKEKILLAIHIGTRH